MVKFDGRNGGQASIGNRQWAKEKTPGFYNTWGLNIINRLLFRLPGSRTQLEAHGSEGATSAQLFLIRENSCKSITIGAIPN